MTKEGVRGRLLDPVTVEGTDPVSTGVTEWYVPSVSTARRPPSKDFSGVPPITYVLS